MKYLDHVKILSNSKLYKTQLRRFMTEIPVASYNFNDLVADLVARALDPTISSLVQMILNIQNESIAQSKIRSIFSIDAGFASFIEVQSELTYTCNLLEIFLGHRVRDSTLQKIKIVLADLNSAFKCLDSIKKTLKISVTWKTVEKLRMTVSWYLVRYIIYIFHCLLYFIIFYAWHSIMRISNWGAVYWMS